MTILVLGGTADAKEIAVALHQCKIPIVYSVAGLVRKPLLKCPVVIGGFTQFGGMARYVESNKITAILDATHPYAVNISRTAVQVARSCSIPSWQYIREPWQASKLDRWFEFSSFEELPKVLEGNLLEQRRSKKTIFFTTGQVTDNILAADSSFGGVKLLVRTAVKPALNLLENVLHIESIGPFTFENELALLKRYDVVAIISKNSGGKRAAKLSAAAMLSIPVFMLTRPELVIADERFYSHDQCLQFVCQKY